MKKEKALYKRNSSNAKYHIVKKHNDLIEAPLPFSLIEQKILLAVIALFQEQTKDLQLFNNTIVFKASDVKKITGLSEDSFRKFESALDKLQSTLIEIKTKEKGNDERRVKVAFFTKAVYHSGVIEVTFDDEVVPFFTNLSTHWTRYVAEQTRPISSAYALRMYELLKQYENTENQYRVFSLDDLRRMLSATDPAYATYANFKLRVLKICQQELDKTDMPFEYEEIRTGKKVTAIKCYLKRRVNGHELVMDLLTKRMDAQNAKDVIADIVIEGHKNGLRVKGDTLYVKRLQGMIGSELEAIAGFVEWECE